MIKLFATTCLLAAAFATSGCARPEAVREVARLSQPIAVGLQRSGQQLEVRMSVQASSFDSAAAALARQEARARARAALIERDFRLRREDNAIRTLVIVREGDAALIADPLSPVAASAPPVATQRQALDLSALDGVIAGFDRLRGPRRATLGDLLVFARDINSELAKLEEEGASATEVPVTGEEP